MLEYQNTKNFLIKDILEIKNIKKLKILFHVHMLLMNDLNGEDIIGTFCEKELQKINQQGFRIEKVIKERK